MASWPTRASLPGFFGGQMLEITLDRAVHRLHPGDVRTFGRGGAGVDYVIGDDDRLHRRAGTITVSESGWDLRNDGRWLLLRIVSAERFGLDVLEPGNSLHVPWKRARVEVVVGASTVGFSAEFRGQNPENDPRPPSFVGDGDPGTVTPTSIERTSGAFRALVALCEPRLRQPGTLEVATDLEIARRLNAQGDEQRRITGKTVERRLDYCRGRLDLKLRGPGGSSIGSEQRNARRHLAEVALMTGTVTVDDLEVLDATPDSFR